MEINTRLRIGITSFARTVHGWKVGVPTCSRLPVSPIIMRPCSLSLGRNTHTVPSVLLFLGGPSHLNALFCVTPPPSPPSRSGCAAAAWRTSPAPGWDTSTANTSPTRSRGGSASLGWVLASPREASRYFWTLWGGFFRWGKKKRGPSP